MVGTAQDFFFLKCFCSLNAFQQEQNQKGALRFLDQLIQISFIKQIKQQREHYL